jgi:4'-phosphopantetheinyl transferase
VRDRLGKPRLSGTEVDLRFNLSHSGALAILGLSLGAELGVDLELVRSDLDMNLIAARFFTPAEHELIGRLKGASRQAAFFRIWTRKEAYSKAIGTGLAQRGSLLVDVLAESPGPCTTPTSLQVGTGQWSVIDVDVACDYAAAVVTEGTQWRLLLFSM